MRKFKGTVSQVSKEIRDDREDDEDDEEYLDKVLDYYLQKAYWSVYSRNTEDARIVAEMVREYIEERESE